MKRFLRLKYMTKSRPSSRKQAKRYDQIGVENLPLVKIRKNKPKSVISLFQLLIIRDIQNLHLDVFVDEKCDAIG